MVKKCILSYNSVEPSSMTFVHLNNLENNTKKKTQNQTTCCNRTWAQNREKIYNKMLHVIKDMLLHYGD